MLRILVQLLVLLFGPALAGAQTAIAIQDLPTEFVGAAAIAFHTAAASMTIKNDGTTFVWIANAGSVPTTVTVVAKAPSSQGYLQHAIYTIEAGKLGVIEALSIQRFNDRRTGLATLQFSATTSIGVAAVRMPHARP
jgi:hypothetical protein